MSSTARLTTQIEPAPELWFVVQTRYRFEKKVAAQLKNKGMQIFLPLRKENRSWGDRTKEILVPLFPGYVFVRSDRSVSDRLIVLQTAGVMGFASLAGMAATVPEKQIEDVQRVLSVGVTTSLYPFAKTGKRIRIRGGSLDGLEGLQTRREKERLLISIEAIQRALAIDIQGFEVETI